MTTTLTSAADALRADEVTRTRAFLRVGYVVAVAVAIALAIVPGDRRIAIALYATLGAGVLGAAWIDLRLRDPDPVAIDALALAAVACGQLGILYLGIFSAAPVMVALGLCFFCRTERTTSAIAIYALAAGAHAIEAGLVIAGVVDDPGAYPVGGRAAFQAQIAGQLVLQLGYAVCFWLARLTRKSSLKSITNLTNETRLAAQRDVQLAELRSDLDRALEIGGPGRFTGHAVGAWQLGNVLGRGAMGEVYEATDGTATEAAVKLLRRELLADGRHVERFLREVRVASAIDSPHVVRVLGSAVEPLPFLAMERLHGQTLGDRLRRGGTLPAADVLTLARHVGHVLERARAAQIVHRDLKPHNLFLTDAGAWKVLDFGVAVLADSSGTLTRGGVIGTPAYMSPEQARGDAVDHRTDVYALGAVLYRCVTGRAPFAARDTPALLYAVVHQMPLRPSAVDPTVPAELDDILAVALAKDRDLRFQTATELVDALGTRPLSDELRRRARAQPWHDPTS